MGEEYGVFMTTDGKTFGMYFVGTSAYKAAEKNRILLFKFGKKDKDAGKFMWTRFPALIRVLKETFYS